MPTAKRMHKTAPPAIAESASAPLAASFDDIENRLVFNPARQATVSTGGAIGQDQSNPSGIVLVGVILDGASRVAVIRRAGETTASRFGEGGTIGEWTLKTIEPDRIVVQSGATTQQIFLAEHPVGLAGVR
jgi:hypothetical protein